MLECMARAIGLGRSGDMAPHGVVLFQSRFDVEARIQLVLARQFGLEFSTATFTKPL